MGAAKKKQPLDHELLAVAWNGTSENERTVDQVMAAVERISKRKRGEIPTPIRFRSTQVTESEVVEALEILAARGDIKRGQRGDGITTYFR